MEFPKYMEKGSRGPAVNIILLILVVYAREVEDMSLHRIECDSVLGDNGVFWVKSFQKAHNLEADGGVGPDTRTFLKERYHLDFEAVARASGGITVFVQPDGREIHWSPN